MSFSPMRSPATFDMTPEVHNMDIHMVRPEIGGISPFFIVQSVAKAFSFYRDRLGFEVTFQGFEDNLFFGIVRRVGSHCGPSFAHRTNAEYGISVSVNPKEIGIWAFR
jgi:hypothetical protein